ncbi:MAG TPA: hypothetical protein PK639_00810 [Candidatus Woesebacteria bacterium]|nr:hypothetical protein [Candidatus Woesebacteria bacterium]
MFEKFSKQNKKYDERITITKSFNFGFPARFFSENNLSSFKYVVLYFDNESKEIGFQFTSDEQEKYKYTLFGQGKTKEGYGGSIIASSFFRNYNIDPKIYHGKYTPEKRLVEGIGDLFVIKLSNKTADITGSSEVLKP